MGGRQKGDTVVVGAVGARGEKVSIFLFVCSPCACVDSPQVLQSPVVRRFVSVNGLFAIPCGPVMN